MRKFCFGILLFGNVLFAGVTPFDLKPDDLGKLLRATIYAEQTVKRTTCTEGIGALNESEAQWKCVTCAERTVLALRVLGFHSEQIAQFTLPGHMIIAVSLQDRANQATVVFLDPSLVQFKRLNEKLAGGAIAEEVAALGFWVVTLAKYESFVRAWQSTQGNDLYNLPPTFDRVLPSMRAYPAELLMGSYSLLTSIAGQNVPEIVNAIGPEQFRARIPAGSQFQKLEF